MSRFPSQRQKTMFSFFFVYFLLLLSVPQGFGQSIANFECDGPTKDNPDDLYGCSLRVILNLTGVLPMLDLPESRPNTPKLRSEDHHGLNPSISLPLEDPESPSIIPNAIDKIRNPSKVPRHLAQRNRDLQENPSNTTNEIDNGKKNTKAPRQSVPGSRDKDLDLQENPSNTTNEIDNGKKNTKAPRQSVPGSRDKDLDLQENPSNTTNEIDNGKKNTKAPRQSVPGNRDKDLDLQENPSNTTNEIDNGKKNTKAPRQSVPGNRDKDLDLQENPSNTTNEIDNGKKNTKVPRQSVPGSQNRAYRERADGKTKGPRHHKKHTDHLPVHVFEDIGDITKPTRKIIEETEMIKNPDFEHNLDGWWCYRCRSVRVAGGYRSNYAAKVVNKGSGVGSLRTSIKAITGIYYFTIYVKLLNPPNEHIPYSKILAHAKIYRRPKTLYIKMGETARVQPNTRWYKIGGDVYVPDDSSTMEVYIQVWNTKLTYVLSHASCVRVDPVPKWKEEADKRIQEIRKANIQVFSNVSSIPEGYRLRITQTKEKFKWGGAVKTWLINKPKQHKKFSQFIYKNFNWAVIENELKWRNDEPAKGVLNLLPAEHAVNHLLKNGLHVRGHTLFYGSADPNWVKQLRGDELMEALEGRIESVMTPFKNKISIWDVSNENLRNAAYEDLTGDQNITQKMFEMAHEKDPKARLFINENMIVNYGFNTVACEDRANMYLDAEIPVHGIGIQSHIRGSFDIFLVMKRLNEVAKAGVPLFISELTYEHQNVQQRVMSYDNLLRIYFSHPAVEGIMFWTVWSDSWRKTAALLDQHFNVNEVGKVFLSLKAEWSTPPIEYDLSEIVKNFSVFLGDYHVELVQFGQTIWEKSLKIETAGSTNTVVIGNLNGEEDDTDEKV